MRSAGLRPHFPPGSAIALAATVLGWLGLVAVAALLLWNSRQDAINEARVRAVATTALLQAHTASTFRAVENALVDVARILERDSLPRHDAGLRQAMRARLPAMPYVRALYVIGPDGFIQHDTDFPATPDVSLADRPYFRQYVAGEDVPTPVSAPIQSRSGTGWFVAMTRRIGEGASFRGVAVAAIQLSYFSALYKEVGLGEGSQIMLFHRDGRLIAQHPDQAAEIGRSFADYPLFRRHLHEANWGAYLSEGEPLPYPRVFSYAAVADMPLVVAQAQNLQARLDAWRRTLLATAAALLLLLAGMLYAVLQFLRARLERHRSRERLLQAEKMEALGQLTGSIAHDFANLLGIVSTNVELLKRLGLPDPRTAAALARVQRAVDSGVAMTRNLMSFSRKRELEITEVDLNEVVAAALPLLEQAAGSTCKVTFEPAPGARRCRADPEQLATALINLVVNARHAIEGTGTIALSVRNVGPEGRELSRPVRGGQPFVCLTVRDDGKGMSEEVRRRAMEPFFTTKGEQGTGLGLAQVFGLMQQLGGDLTIDSAPGAGTAIHLCFPALEEGAPQPGG